MTTETYRNNDITAGKGTCPVCLKAHTIRNGRLVRHGFFAYGVARGTTGGGWQTAGCDGEGLEALERSDASAGAAVKLLLGTVESYQRRLESGQGHKYMSQLDVSLYRPGGAESDSYRASVAALRSAFGFIHIRRWATKAEAEDTGCRDTVYVWVTKHAPARAATVRIWSRRGPVDKYVSTINDYSALAEVDRVANASCLDAAKACVLAAVEAINAHRNRNGVTDLLRATI